MAEVHPWVDTQVADLSRLSCNEQTSRNLSTVRKTVITTRIPTHTVRRRRSTRRIALFSRDLSTCAPPFPALEESPNSQF
ncbi:hypothetical protein KC354_g11 [Hortaea werneckii]|nr:hypothetical protein KC354_g11 [Hortaea werneckii]